MPHCGLRYNNWNGWCTPVLKPIAWHETVAAPLQNEDTIDDILECCGHTHCVAKDRELATALAENLQHKLDLRRWTLMIKERNAGV